MITWEGRFNWQEYALTGRPDFLNYLHAGDVTWEELWDYYRRQPASPDAIRSLTRLFHLFLSCEYDAAGCWLDPEGELAARLRAWAEFTLDRADDLLEEVQADLAGLVGSGLVTPLYYRAAYLTWMEASVDRHAAAWKQGGIPSADFFSELPGPDARHLPVYHPDPTRFPDLLGNPAWNDALRTHVAAQYCAWNHHLCAHVPDWEEEEAWTMIGGEA